MDVSLGDMVSAGTCSERWPWAQGEAGAGAETKNLQKSWVSRVLSGRKKKECWFLQLSVFVWSLHPHPTEVEFKPFASMSQVSLRKPLGCRCLSEKWHKTEVFSQETWSSLWEEQPWIWTVSQGLGKRHQTTPPRLVLEFIGGGGVGGKPRPGKGECCNCCYFSILYFRGMFAFAPVKDQAVIRIGMWIYKTFKCWCWWGCTWEIQSEKEKATGVGWLWTVLNIDVLNFFTAWNPVCSLC